MATGLVTETTAPTVRLSEKRVPYSPERWKRTFKNSLSFSAIYLSEKVRFCLKSAAAVRHSVIVCCPDATQLRAIAPACYQSSVVLNR